MKVFRVLVMFVAAGFVLSGCITAKPMEEKAVMAADVGDADGDGVLDDADKCPGTRAGAEVDHKGCEIFLRLSAVNFDFDSAKISPQGQDILAGVLAAMNKHPDNLFEIAGHTDSTGPDAYNMKLGERRAGAVQGLLVGEGIGSSRLEVISYGETKPIESNDTKEGRAANRRVEIVDRAAM